MPPRKRTEGLVEQGDESLINEVSDVMKKKGFPSFFLNIDEAPTDLTDFISTGSSLLDLAISNRPNGGIAVGRITEISGMEGAGKSLLCAHMVANVQKEGGVAWVFDTESAINTEFFEAIGVDFNKVKISYLNTVEDIFEAIEVIVTQVRAKKDNKRKVLIVVDSIANASTKKEMEADYDKNGYGTEKAYLLSQALRKITGLLARQKIALVITNQLRYKMNAQPFADPFTTPGGKALPYAASTRVRLAVAGAIKTKEKEQIGVKVSAKIVKNRLGPPNRQVNFDVYYDRGVDDVSSWIGYLKDKEIIDGGAAGHYTFTDSDGIEHKFTSGTWKQFCEDNPKTFEQIYTRMADSMIMQYNSEGLSTLDGTAQVDTDQDSE